MRLAWRTLSPMLWKYRRGLGIGLGALLLKDLFGALLPLAIKAGVDSLTQGFALSKLLWFTGAMLALSAVKGVFQFIMRVRILDQGFFGRYRTGDIMARATNDLNAVRMMMGPGVMYWTETSITFVLAATIMAYVDWKLTLVALLPAPIVSLAVIWFGRQIHMRFERIQALFSDISSRVQENLSGVRVIRAYVQEENQLHQFERLNQDYIKQNMKLVLTSGMFMPMLETLIGMALLIVLWVGGARLLEGHMTLGSFLMFNVYMGILAWPMIALGWVVNLMQRGTASLERLNALMAEKPSITAPVRPAALPDPIRGEIAFRDVTVQFGDRRAIDELNLTIPAAATVAIVGHTGSGKTTLVHLIPRMIDPTRGAVLLDGTDLREFDPEPLRRAIGFVPQETFLFSATLGGRDSPRGFAGRSWSGPGRVSEWPCNRCGRARHYAFRRSEATHRNRPRHSARSIDPHPRRCAVERGYGDGGGDSAKPRQRDEGPYDDFDFTPRFDGAAGRPDLRNRRGAAG
jgi:ATP-binding cassette, subfamily B, multidrug efflux pump